MIWLTWRRHRKAALFATVGLAVLAAVLVPTGRQMYRAMADTGLASCLDRMSRAEFIADGRSDPLTGLPDCEAPAELFTNQFGDYALPAILLVFLPLLVGMFLGAPLVAREVEHGTHRLVWTQGVSRLRWALVSFGLVGTGALVIAAGYAALVSWWITPLARATASGFDRLFFDVQGAVPVAYTVFTVALGIVAGTVWRRTLPAMAVTLVGFIVARVAVGALRPHFLPPVESRFPGRVRRVRAGHIQPARVPAGRPLLAVPVPGVWRVPGPRRGVARSRGPPGPSPHRLAGWTMRRRAAVIAGTATRSSGWG